MKGRIVGNAEVSLLAQTLDAAVDLRFGPVGVPGVLVQEVGLTAAVLANGIDRHMIVAAAGALAGPAALARSGACEFEHPGEAVGRAQVGVRAAAIRCRRAPIRALAVHRGDRCEHGDEEDGHAHFTRMQRVSATHVSAPAAGLQPRWQPTSRQSPN